MKKKVNIAECKMVGAYVPLPFVDYLNLYSLSNSIHKSKLVRGLVKTWVENSIESIPKESLMDKIRDRIQSEWDLQKMYNNNFQDFKKKKSTFLALQGIEKSTIEEILKTVKNEKNK